MSRTPSATGLALLTLPAAALVSLGAVFALRPTLLLERVPELEGVLASVDPGTVVLALAVVFVVSALALGLTGRLRRSTPSPIVAAEPAATEETAFDDRSSVARTDRVGARIDELVATATAYDSEPRDVREAAREGLLESLRPIAATAYANRAGVSVAEATAAVEAGTWTDDPRAAAFLATPDGPSIPLWLWLVDLVRTASPFAAHLEATLDEIERLQSAATVARPDADTDTESEPETDSAGESTEVPA